MTENPRNHRPRISFGNSPSSEQPLLPLRLVAVADLAPEGSPLRSGGAPLRVDKDSFNEVLRTICPRVVFHVHSRYPPGNALSKIEFAVEDLRSFHPAQLAQEVESLRRGGEGRQALLDLRDRKISIEQFMEMMKSSPLPFLTAEALSSALEGGGGRIPKPSPVVPPKPVWGPAVSGEDTLDSILDLVEAPEEMRREPVGDTEGAARLQQFISEIFAGTATRTPVDQRALEVLAAQTDAAISEQMSDILRHPEFRRLEAAWRSLRFLVDRTDFRESIELEVIPAAKEHLARVLSSRLEEAETAETPLAAIITDFEFETSAPDMELLKEAATLAEQLQAPLLVNVGSKFFGKKDAAEVSRIPLLRTFLDSPEFVKWAALRESEASRWVGVGFNRFLLRNRYEELSSGKMPFRFNEQGSGVWGNASWAIGTLLTRSYAQSGWCGHFTGARGGGLINDLLVHSYQLPSDEETQIPLETVFLRDREEDFFQAGFLVLQCGENQDKAVLLCAPSAHRPEVFSDSAETEASRWRATLTYQMVAARFVHYLGPLVERLLPLGNQSEIERSVERELRALMRLSGGGDTTGVDVRLLESEERPAFYELRINIRPGPAIWSLPAKIELAIPVPKS
jgi:type VI secretion system protein ImpC